MFDPQERRYLESSRVARLATADAAGRPHVVPVCFTLVGDDLVVPLDEKPKRVSATDLKRVRNIEANPRVALVTDHYTEDWSALGWVQIRGTATVQSADEDTSAEARATLRQKYEQYEDHDLAGRPVIRVSPGSVVSWGTLEP